VGPDGAVYVVDRVATAPRIEKFTSDGVFVTAWGGYGEGDGQFHSPTGIAVAATGRVYVADWHLHRIQVFGTTPTPTKTYSWGRIKALYR